MTSYMISNHKIIKIKITILSKVVINMIGKGVYYVKCIYF